VNAGFGGLAGVEIAGASTRAVVPSSRSRATVTVPSKASTTATIAARLMVNGHRREARKGRGLAFLLNTGGETAPLRPIGTSLSAAKPRDVHVPHVRVESRRLLG
jgi:hypothetical protein